MRITLRLVICTLFFWAHSMAQPCEITDPGIINLGCNIPSAGIVIFSLNPTSTGTGSTYSISTSQGFFSGSIGEFGQVSDFLFQPSVASPAEITITITDQNNPSCSLTFTFDNPCPSVSNCLIQSFFVSTVQCNDNGTPNDPTDDFYDIVLNPTGSGLGSGYNVTSSISAFTPSSASYGSPSTFETLPGTATGDNFTITVTDADDPDCSATTTIASPPGPCSNQPPCNITFSFNGNIICDDNGTPNDPSDDTFTTEVQVTGTGLGNNGWIASDPLGTTGSYNQFVTLGPYLISDGSFNISFEDVDNPGCESITVQVTPPAPCSNPVCDLEVLGGAVICDDGGTPGDLSDDTFFQNIVVNNGGASGNWVSNSPDNNSGILGVSQTIGPFNSNGGQDLTFTISDANNPDCSIIYTIDNPCQSQVDCNLTNPGLGFTTCNDNGTPNDPSDDFYTFPLNPEGAGLGGGYTVSVSAGTLDPLGGNYGGETVFTLTGVSPPGGISVIITDNNDPDCTTNTIINLPPPCSSSPACDINVAQIGNVLCLDNGTPNDPSDDIFTFELLVIGSNAGSEWQGNDPLSTTGTYDELIIMGPYPISGGGFEFIATDLDDPDCSTTPITIAAPDPCSVPLPCNISDVNIGSVLCGDNNTLFNSNDDFVIFDLNPFGNSLGSGYTVTTNLGQPVPAIGDYGVLSTFQLPAGSAGGVDDIIVTVTDLDDPSCNLTITISNPGICSTPCDIDVVIQEILCNDNGTPSVTDDDIFFAEVFVNGSGSGWVSDDPFNTGGLLGVNADLGPFSISDGTVIITISNLDDPSCQQVISIDPPATCSDGCAIQGVISNPICDDNGTPGISADDTFTATLTVTGQNTGTAWSTGFPIDQSGGYNEAVVIGPFPTSQGDINVTITDDVDTECTTTLLLVSTGGCSSGCPPADTTFITDVSCNPADTLTQVQSFTNALGCDSVVVNIVSLLRSDTLEINIASCNPADTGVVETLFVNEFGCDSLVIETTSLLASDTLIIEQFSCNPMDTGRVEILFQNQFGCDSLVIETIGLLRSDTILISQFSCNPSDTGRVELLLENEFGCDSLVITQTGFREADTTIVNLVSCNPSDTGIVEILLENQFGCDSLVLESTSFLPGDTVLVEQFSCDPVDTGRVEVLLENQFGCDSLVIIETAFREADTTFVNLVSCSPADTGTVETVLLNQFDCDSLIIEVTSLVPSDTTLLEQLSCNPADTGVVETLLINSFDCDSLVIITTSFDPITTTNLNQTLCFRETITINGTVYDADNPIGSDTLTASNGCDSIVVVELFFSEPPNEVFIDTTLCSGEQIVINGQVYNEDQVSGNQTITGQNGCDSLILNILVTFNNINIESRVSQPPCLGLDGNIEVLQIEGGSPPFSLQFGNRAEVILDTFPFSITDITPGEYLVQVEDNLGCNALETFLIVEGEEPTVNLGPDLEVSIGETIQLSPDIFFDFDTLVWTPDELLSCVGCLNPEIDVFNDVIITLTAFNDEGCFGEDEIQIFLAQSASIYAPNAFTPNGDGINDFFTLFMNDPDTVIIRSFSVYNRWGDRVFEVQDITPGVLNEGWDGTFGGQPLDPSVFVFYAELEFSDGATEVVSGEVNLMR